MRHLAQIANAFVSQACNFPLTGESMGPKNTSGSPSSQAIRTAVSKALVVVGDQSKIDAVWLDGARSDSVHDRLERSLRLYRERPIRLPASRKSEGSGEYHTTTAAGGDAAANRAQSSDRQRAISPLGGEA